MLAVALPLMAAALGAYITLLAARLSRAPTLADQASFAWVAGTASAFAACNVLTYSPTAPDGAVLAAVRVQLALGLLNVVAWHRYASAFLGRRSPLDRPLAWACGVVAALTLWPGLAVSRVVGERAWAPGLVYHDTDATPLADLALGLALLGAAAAAARFLAAWRQGVRYAGVHAAAVGALAAMAVNDALVFLQAYRGYYLLDSGFLLPVAVVAFAMSARVVSGARALAELQHTLEARVAERTAALAASEERLAQAERLAGLGRLAAGVAHEVNSPAATLAANLRYLREALAPAQAAPADADECLRDAEAALERITRLARQLLDTGRVAASRERPQAPVSLRAVADEALRMARARLPAVRFEALVPEGLIALGDHELLVQATVNLLVNGGQALEPGRGTVRLGGASSPGRVALVVQDDGAGMAPETLRRVFEPFFSTKPFGEGTGLGLSVSRGLVTAMGGELTLESAPGAGTRATIELPAG